MVSFGRGRHENDRAGAAEDPVVRQYRFLLRQASPDAVESAHADALLHLGVEERQVILAAVQQGLLAGQRLEPEDTAQIAHLVVHGEQRSPNAFLSACAPATLMALARAVIDSEASFGLFGQYAVWDGNDPEPADEPDDGGAPRRGRWRSAGSPSKDGAGGYPGGYPGGRLPDSTGKH